MKRADVIAALETAGWNRMGPKGINEILGLAPVRDRFESRRAAEHYLEVTDRRLVIYHAREDVPGELDDHTRLVSLPFSRIVMDRPGRFRIGLLEFTYDTSA